MKLTEWFEYGKHKPLHEGWYQCLPDNSGLGFLPGAYGYIAPMSNIVWRYWTGIDWIWVNDKQCIAPSAFSLTDKWRGIQK